MVLAKECLTFKTAWGWEEVGNQDYSVFRLFVFNVRLEDDLSVVPWIMIDCRYPLLSSPWIRLIVPFGVRNSTLPVFGACEFFFGPPPCRSSPQMPVSGQSRFRQSTGGIRPNAMRKMPAPLHNVACSQRTSIPERPAQIAWPCSLRHCHCSSLRYLPLLLCHHDLACFGWPKFRITIQTSMTWETGDLQCVGMD